MRIILKDGTGSIDLKFLVEDCDRHGNVRIYFRQNRRKIRLRAEIGTAEFLAEYHTARTAKLSTGQSSRLKNAPTRGTFRWLVAEYYRSAEFTQLDPATRKMRRRDLDAIALKHGDKRYAVLVPRNVKTLRDEKAATPHAANNLLKTLRVFLQWAVENDLMDRNPAREIRKIKVASEGHHSWTDSEIHQFMRRHPENTKAGLALALLFYTGLRRSDVVRLGRQMLTEEGTFRVREMKGSRRKVKEAERPIHPELARVISLHQGDHLTYLTTEYGASFTAAGFGNWFKERCVEAGLPRCSAHGLRKAAATKLAERGGTPHHLMAYFGWSDLAQPTHYTRSAELKKLAAEAAELILLPVQTGNETVSPFPAISSGGTLRAKK